MAIRDFARLLNEAIGLDAASIGASAVERAVRERMAACGVANWAVYLELARASEVELQELIEAVVVPETWFFRDRDAFSAFVSIVQGKCASARGRIVRALSLPCATGEEPYSMAMALLDAGVGKDTFRVDGIDISERALDEAREGVYGRGSFRGHALDFRGRHFDALERGYRIREAVRHQVGFRRGNLLNAATLPGMGIYDVVFCRNVLIYFDRASQERAIAMLARLMTSDGLLFVGPAESGLMLNHGFVAERMPKAHAFRIERRDPLRSHVPAKRRRIPLAPPKPVKVQPKLQPSVARPVESKSLSLDDVVRLADEGRFADAAACCEQHLKEHGPSAQAFYLLGLVRDAAGYQTDAGRYYRKALYLDPQHHDALVHLAVLADTDNAAEAERLRTRARRVGRQEGAS